MSASLLSVSPPIKEGFRHEAFFYRGDEEFVAGALAFLREAIRAGAPALAVVSSRKIELLRARLGAEAATVHFADMAEVGINPARITAAWSEFVDRYRGRPLWGMGEPIWAERSPAELVECQRHESLLNVAFAGIHGFRLLCPYDTGALEAEVVDEARRSHPFLRADGSQSSSVDYLGTESHAGPFSTPLPEPPSSSVDLVFQVSSLGGLRSLVWREAMTAGIGEDRAEDAVAAVNEVASNTIRHAGGWGVLRIWQAEETLICEVSDDGHIDDPLAGRLRPRLDTAGGRGLWMVNQLCDLVQVRSFATGTAIRMHLRRTSD